MKFIDLSAQFLAYEGEIRAAVDRVFASGQYILGPALSDLEAGMAAFCGARHAVGCASGTDALVLALAAAGVGPGDEVVTSPFTFAATAEAPVLLGAKVVFADIDPAGFTLDPAAAKAAVTPRTKAIIPVSLYGQCADMEALGVVARGAGAFLVEDAAQSFGASRRGTRSCGFPGLAATSFFPSKPLGACGDGGMVFAGDDALATRLRLLRNHGQAAKYRHTIVGYNSRLDELQAAILLAKLSRFGEELAARARIASRYDEALRDVVRVPALSPGNDTHVYAQYTVRTDARDALVRRLGEKGIPTAIHYPVPLHMQEAFASAGYREGAFPAAEAAAKEVVSLPMSAFLAESDQEAVIVAVREFFGRSRRPASRGTCPSPDNGR